MFIFRAKYVFLQWHQLSRPPKVTMENRFMKYLVDGFWFSGLLEKTFILKKFIEQSKKIGSNLKPI